MSRHKRDLKDLAHCLKLEHGRGQEVRLHPSSVSPAGTLNLSRAKFQREAPSEWEARHTHPHPRTPPRRWPISSSLRVGSLLLPQES